MRITFALILILIINPFSVNAQEAQCAEDQLYGCGAFTVQDFPRVQRTICGCFTVPEEPVERGVGLRSCRSECPINDGIRSTVGCQCLRGPITIPGLRQPVKLPTKELGDLFKLKLNNPELYELYIDTQINPTNGKPVMSVEKFTGSAN